ncbi:MAG: AAA family ATPase, partial [Planctomycetes bacterium]|nr:AAA family ATPase [Planctomycetota bacterium]
MYESAFGFRLRPFAAAPTVALHHPVANFEKARTALVRCIEHGGAPGLVVGPAGVGKSLLCQMLAEQFRERFCVVMLTSARLCTRRALLQNILFELGLPYRDLEEGELRLSLIDYLANDEQAIQGMLLIVDEAHSLPTRLLEEIRMITNLVRDGKPRVRLILAGNARLEERFASPKLESFNQRIATRCYLEALGREETKAYIRSQLTAAGGSAAEVFCDDALSAVYDATGGVPRLVNQVCDHALVLACVGGVRRIDAAGIQEAWADLQQLPAPWHMESSPQESVVEFGRLDEAASASGEEAVNPLEQLSEIEESVAVAASQD